jgi:hypothetical protein
VAELYYPHGTELLDKLGLAQPHWHLFFESLQQFSNNRLKLVWNLWESLNSETDTVIDYWPVESGNAVFVFYVALATSAVAGGILGTLWKDDGTLASASFRMDFPGIGTHTGLTFNFNQTSVAQEGSVIQLRATEDGTNTYDLQFMRILI